MVLPGHVHWQKGVYFKLCQRLTLRGVGILVWWHSVEAFDFTPADRVSFYVLVPPWWGEYEVRWSYEFGVHPSLRIIATIFCEACSSS